MNYLEKIYNILMEQGDISKAKKPTGFTITPLDRSEPVKTTEGKETIRTLDQAINDLFGKAVPKQLP